MSGKKQDRRPEARLPKGMRDVEADEIRAMQRMLGVIRGVYESYGFEPLDTPAFEYTDALGKFLPDQDRPNEGVFSFQDEDEQWLSLRYDLTAPLARYVAQNFDRLPKPFRRYQTGPVWRNEKPGPGRFRQFTQFDADTVGTDSVAADAELCMLAADTLEALGVPRGGYIIKVGNRKIFDGILDAIGLSGDENAARRLIALRAIDKLDRLGSLGVKELLGSGREDESGDFTQGARLEPEQIDIVLAFLEADVSHNPSAALLPRENPQLSNMKGGILYPIPAAVERSAKFFEEVQSSPLIMDGIAELDSIRLLYEEEGYGPEQIQTSFSIVRGLEYYTGAVYEAELTFEAIDEKGRRFRFGSVGGGGRYDGLVERFKGAKVPATGFSIGVSRLYAALQALGRLEADAASGPVVVLAMDRDRTADFFRLTGQLRQAGIRAEMYLGASGMKAQMKYADRRGSPCVVIQGADELARGEVTIKDLIEGERLSAEIGDNQAWREGRPAQFSVPVEKLVEAVRSVLERHKAG